MNEALDRARECFDRRAWGDAYAQLSAADREGFHYYLKSEYLSHLSSEFLGAFHRAALQVTSPVSESMIVHIGGALNELEPHDGADPGNLFRVNRNIRAAG